MNYFLIYNFLDRPALTMGLKIKFRDWNDTTEKVWEPATIPLGRQPSRVHRVVGALSLGLEHEQTYWPNV